MVKPCDGDTYGRMMHRGVSDRIYTIPLQCLCYLVRNTVLYLWICRGSFGYEFDTANFVSYREVVRRWRERGVRVMPWTVNLPLEKQYCRRILKVTYLTDTLIGENDEPTLLWLPITLKFLELIYKDNITFRKCILTCLPWKYHYVSKIHAIYHTFM